MRGGDEMRKTHNSIGSSVSGLPFSTMTEFGDLLFLSGVTATDLDSGKTDGDAGEQARTALNKIGSILEKVGRSLDDVLKVTVYVKDMGTFGEVNAVYRSAFNAPYPARTCVEVAALPMGALVEIDVICGKT
jgi:2-iminobutanoate/2-iminopropanoate deaminase